MITIIGARYKLTTCVATKTRVLRPLLICSYIANDFYCADVLRRAIIRFQRVRTLIRAALAGACLNRCHDRMTKACTVPTTQHFLAALAQRN